MPDSNIDDLIRETFDLFRSNAEQLAIQFGCTVDGLIFDVTYRNPFFVPDKDYAAQRAEELSKSIALTQGHTLGANEFLVVANGSGTGRIGFAPDGTPKVCILKGVAKATSEDGALSYISVAFVYSLQTNGVNGSAAPHKP